MDFIAGTRKREHTRYSQGAGRKSTIGIKGRRTGLIIDENTAANATGVADVAKFFATGARRQSLGRRASFRLEADDFDDFDSSTTDFAAPKSRPTSSPTPLLDSPIFGIGGRPINFTAFDSDASSPLFPEYRQTPEGEFRTDDVYLGNGGGGFDDFTESADFPNQFQIPNPRQIDKIEEFDDEKEISKKHRRSRHKNMADEDGSSTLGSEAKMQMRAKGEVDVDAVMSLYVPGKKVSLRATGKRSRGAARNDSGQRVDLQEDTGEEDKRIAQQSEFRGMEAPILKKKRNNTEGNGTVILSRPEARLYSQLSCNLIANHESSAKVTYPSVTYARALHGEGFKCGELRVGPRSEYSMAASSVSCTVFTVVSGLARVELARKDKAVASFGVSAGGIFMVPRKMDCFIANPSQESVLSMSRTTMKAS